MATFVRHQWSPTVAGQSRRDRQGCAYDAYVPDGLVGWNLAIPGDVAADIADAERAVTRLNVSGTSHVSLEGLARFLLRAEAVGSSRIEGIAPAVRRLARAEAALTLGGDAGDQAAAEVIGNIRAMEGAIERATRPDRFTLDDLLDIHRLLMEQSPTPEIGGVVRTTQNWIGGSSYNPCSAAFVPPPPELLEELLADLIDYVNDDAHSPLAQAALAHSQFETLHPFADGNGRTGRALIHVILRRRGLAPSFVPPISLVLATRSADYVGGLTSFRHSAASDAPERSHAAAEWLSVVASATSKACSDAAEYSASIDRLDRVWRTRIGRVRADSAADRLLRVLPGAPIITVESAAALVGRSPARVAVAVKTSSEAGVLRQRNVGRQRNRVFEAVDVIDLFTDLERSLAAPT